MSNKKIDKRRHYILAIDTETAGSIQQPLVYDFGVRVYDTKGNVYEEASWVIYETYVGQKEKMKNAYYANKLPQYEEGLKNGTWKMVKMMTAFRITRNWMEDYCITEILAYNTNFDRKALDRTLAANTNYHFFFPKDTVFLDAWNAACSSIFQQKNYYKRALEQGWVSEKGNVRTNAEVGYAYITGRIDFEEAHTALEDVKIEMEIYLHCLRLRVKVEDRQTIYNPWRKPQPKWREFLTGNT